MAKYTQNYNLKKPDEEDFYNINDYNDNMDIIDTALKSHDNALNTHMSDGTQHAKTARFVVGTSTAGWTAADCDYLCDGTADQVEINNAIQALPDEGGEIIILNGTYNITSRINVNKDNVSIRGNGNATILKRMWDSPLVEGVITLTSVEGCRVENLQINGNNTTYTATSNRGIHLISSSNNIITGNTCNNNNRGIFLNSSNNNTITGNTCNNNNDIGIFLYSSSSNNTIMGNTCNNNNRGIRLDLSSNNTVTGNTCNDNNRSIYLVSSSNNMVTGNTCNDNINGIFLNSSNNNTITGNTFNNNSNSGIHLYSSSNNNVITGNTCIRGMGTPEDYTADQHTIFLSGTNNNYNLITSNNCMGKAPVVQGGIGNTVFNNKWDASEDMQNIEEQINTLDTEFAAHKAEIAIHRRIFIGYDEPLNTQEGDIWLDLNPPRKILADWRMLETVGEQVIDYSGNGYHGQIIGGVTRVPPINDGSFSALQGDGKTGYVQTNFNALAGLDNFKVEVFVVINGLAPGATSDLVGWNGIVNHYRTSGTTPQTVGYYISYQEWKDEKEPKVRKGRGFAARMFARNSNNELVDTYVDLFSYIYADFGDVYKLTFEFDGSIGIATFKVEKVLADGQLNQKWYGSSPLTGVVSSGANPLVLMASNKDIVDEYGNITLGRVTISTKVKW